MDEELRQHFDAMQAKLDAMQAKLMEHINAGHERILNRLTVLERDFANTKDFLVGDALVASRRWLDLESRVARLEQKRGE